MSLPKTRRQFFFSVLWAVVLLLLSSEMALSSPPKRSGVRTIYLDEMDIAVVSVHPDGSVVTFPVKPEIHVGKKGSFNTAFVENDLIVSGSVPGSKTNLFIYLQGRRVTLKLTYNGVFGDQIIYIRDRPKDRWEVPIVSD